MAPRVIRLPSDHRTHSRNITLVRVIPGKSESLERPFLQIFEGTTLVYEGIVDLNDPEVAFGFSTLATA